MRSVPYTYEEALAASERVRWRVEDLLGPDHRLDFRRPFLPEALARVESLRFLGPSERLLLNQIRGHGYLATFGLAEAFILPFVLDHARPALHGDAVRTRAFLVFAAEEAKHIHLFEHFRQSFSQGFSTPCETVGPPADFARDVLSHHPLGVALAVLHVEWTTQRHWIEAARDDGALDPAFKRLLQHHWMEEAQHARLDALMVRSMAARCSATEVRRAVDDYLSIGALFDEALARQAAFDRAALEAALGRTFDEATRTQLVAAQHQALRWTFLGSGMTHPEVLDVLAELDPASRERVTRLAPAFC